MNITSANTQSLTDITKAFNKAGVGADKEVRAKSGGKVLYQKTKSEGHFTSKATRAQKQDQARELIGSALQTELAGKPGAKIFEGVVRKNLRDIFEGSGAVTKGDFDRVKSESDRVQSTYDSYRTSKEGFAEDPHFEAGRKNASAVLLDTPGYSADMGFFDVVELYVQTLNGPKPLTDEAKEQLGALGARAKDIGSTALDIESLTRATEAVQLGVEHGATSVKALPQTVPLQQMGNAKDQQGRCTPLVALTALAESGAPKGADGVMRRMEQETHLMHKAGLRERSPYASQLGTLHGAGCKARIRDSSDSEIGTIGHRKAVGHMMDNFRAGDGDPIMYGVEVRGHIMLIGATKHEGKDSFIFYDPNFGMARFDTEQDLTRYMDDYFGKLGYSEDYSMKDLGADGFQFTVAKQFDLEALGALQINGSDIHTMLEPR